MINNSNDNQPDIVDDKIIIIDSGQTYLYNKVVINNKYEVLVPPISKHTRSEYNIDEVLFIPDMPNSPDGIRFTFTNTLNLRTITNPVPEDGETFVSNIFVKIEEFDCQYVSKTIIIGGIKNDISPDRNQIIFSGSSDMVRNTIQKQINSIIISICDIYTQRGYNGDE